MRSRVVRGVWLLTVLFWVVGAARAAEGGQGPKSRQGPEYGQGPKGGQGEEAVRFQKAWMQLDAFVFALMKEENVPGLALAVTNRTGLLHVKTYGWADVGARAPVTTETLFEIGSISKSFTAITLLQLREHGKFDPHAPITTYLPWFKVNSRFGPITGHHLLNHTAGLPRDRDDIPASRYQAAALTWEEDGHTMIAQ